MTEKQRHGECFMIDSKFKRTFKVDIIGTKESNKHIRRKVSLWREKRFSCLTIKIRYKYSGTASDVVGGLQELL